MGVPVSRAPIVVMLGGRGPREFAVVRDLGFRILYLDRQVPLAVMPQVDIPVDVDLRDLDAVEAVVRAVCADDQPRAVLTHVEPWLTVMTSLRARLGLPERGLTHAAAHACRDKLRTRQMLAAAGVPSPEFRSASTVEQAVEAAQELGFPVVVKPRDGAGGLGVRHCMTKADVRAAAAAILTLDTHLVTQPGVLVERYVGGPEYAVQTLTVAGRTQVACILAQQTTSPPIFVELGYRYPSGLSDSDQDRIATVVSDGLRAVGLDDWISHTQVRIGPNGPEIIEINARRPGGRLVELTRAVSGIDLLRAASELAAGLPITVGTPETTCAGYRSLVFTEPGVLEYNERLEMTGLRTSPPPIVEVDVAPGDPVRPVDDPAGGVYGRIVAYGDAPAEVTDAIARIAATLDARVLPAATSHTADVREFKSCC